MVIDKIHSRVIELQEIIIRKGNKMTYNMKNLNKYYRST